MSDMLEFTTKPKADPAEAADAEGIPLFRCKLDGVELVARRPKDALIAQLGPIQSRRTPAVRKVQLALDFLDDCLLEPGKTAVRERLLNPDDSLDAEDCMAILEAIGKHWQTNRPAGL